MRPKIRTGEAVQANTNSSYAIHLIYDKLGECIPQVEEEGGQLTGFECKWGSEKWRVPETFTSAYPGSQVHLVNRSNVLDYL